MSEFSESYHLSKATMGDAEVLLKRADLHGHVLSTVNGWTSFVAEGIPYQPNADLIRCNHGLMLRYMHAEDHGCAFELYDATERVAAYKCSWEDELHFEQDIDWPRLMTLLVLSLADASRVQAALQPVSIEAALTAPPARVFAEAIGVSNLAWLSYDYVERDSNSW